MMTYFNAPMLFWLAKQAYERTKVADSDLAWDQKDALVALVFSAASLEAFINEAARLATPQDEKYLGRLRPAELGTFFDQFAVSERARAQVDLKYEIAFEAFGSESFKPGTALREDFDLVIELRNWIVHSRPRDVDRYDSNSPGPKFWLEPPPNMMKRLRSKNVLAKFDDARASTTWFYWVTTRAMARWACNTVAAIFAAFMEAAPMSEFRNTIQFGYGETFKAVR